MDRVIDEVTPMRKVARATSKRLSPISVEPVRREAGSPEEHVDGGIEVLYAAAAELLNAKDVSAVLTTAIRQARKLLSTDVAFVMLLNPLTNVLRLEASVGHRTPTFTTIMRPVRESTAVGTGKPVQSADFLNDSRLDHDPPTDEILRKEGMRTVLAVPLRSPGGILGALYVGNRYVHRFPPAEVDVLLQLADRAASALVLTQAHEEALSRLDQATKHYAEAEAQRALLARAEEIRRTVTDALQERDGLTAVTGALAECLDRTLMVTDWKLTVMAHVHGHSTPTGVKSLAAVLNRPESLEAVAACTDTHRPVRAGKDWLVAPIEAGRNLLGYLWVTQPADPRETELVELVMERMIPLVAMERFSKGDTERRQYSDFIYELLSDRFPDLSMLEARAAQVWGRYGEVHRPVILNISATGEQWGNRLEVARRLIATAMPHEFAAVYGGHLILLITPAQRQQVEVTVSEIRQLLERNHLNATAVVGAECRDLREWRDCILSALKLNDLLGTSGILWADGLEALAQLFEPTQRDRLEVLCRAALAPLKGKKGLMDALQAYFQCGGNKADAARRLSIHVNTLRQRIERAEQLLGGSIDDSMRAVPLRLALLVREVIPDS
jgi:sugar diacid utilization regulator